MNQIFTIFLLSMLFGSFKGNTQSKFEFEGQFSAFGNYSPNAKPSGQLGGRYIPELNFSHELGLSKAIDFEGSVNMYGLLSTSDFENFDNSAKIKPYRIWGRYSGKQFELRIGLQKIDFGSSTMLRPLQWFNEIDPRDPLKLTNGVYGALGRYYFLNNANVWIWMLYGNEKTRGFDAVRTQKQTPEFGGRFQYPIPKGELGVSYHHRAANTQDLPGIPVYNRIPEDRYALDGKWDVVIGLWFEAVHIQKHKELGFLTNQTLLNLGADYTVGLGNGLYVVTEHLVVSMDESPFMFQNNSNISAATISYPLGLFDSLTSVSYYNWTSETSAFFVNYQHQFKKITSYLMAYYNPKSQHGIQENELLNMSTGPGLRFMLVYNH